MTTPNPTATPTSVAYRWVSYLDDLTEKRLSDWDRAATCGRCGATIVHVYTLAYPDGRTEDVGRECLDVRTSGRGEFAKKSALDALRNVDFQALQEVKRAKGLIRAGAKLGQLEPRVCYGQGNLFWNVTPAAALDILIGPAHRPGSERLVAFKHPALPAVTLVDFIGSHPDYAGRSAALSRAGWVRVLPPVEGGAR